MEYELKPCPFCGGKVELITCCHDSTWNVTYRVDCSACGAHTFFVDHERTEAETVALYNRRLDWEQIRRADRGED